jgi:hypothetical protein
MAINYGRAVLALALTCAAISATIGNRSETAALTVILLPVLRSKVN